MKSIAAALALAAIFAASQTSEFNDYWTVYVQDSCYTDTQCLMQCEKDGNAKCDDEWLFGAPVDCRPDDEGCES